MSIGAEMCPEELGDGLVLDNALLGELAEELPVANHFPIHHNFLEPVDCCLCG